MKGGMKNERDWRMNVHSAEDTDVPGHGFPPGNMSLMFSSLSRCQEK